jgi:hypothetical protein
MKDRDVRDALWARLAAEYQGDTETLLLHELGLRGGVSRIDLAVVNGSIHGFEIKSECDTLERLPFQVAVYSQVFNLVTIVVAGRHWTKALSIIPEWWGVMVATPEGATVSFEQKRLPRQNPQRDHGALLELLWREECLAMLQSVSASDGVRGATKPMLRDKIVALFSCDQIDDHVLRSLKARERWRDLGSPGTPSVGPFRKGRGATGR